MTKPRKVETDQGIQGELNVSIYDQMQKRLRDKGWIETNDIIKSGITEFDCCVLHAGGNTRPHQRNTSFKMPGNRKSDRT